MEVLVVVDMQKDFIDGSLGTKEAVAIVPKVVEKIKGFCGKVIYTKDTHGENYLETREGKYLPVPHCIKGTKGWELDSAIEEVCNGMVIEKPSFGSLELSEVLKEEHEKEGITKITFVGLCTDICVVSNAMIAKANLPEVDMVVDASCCAGVTVQSHESALATMKMCQIEIANI